MSVIEDNDVFILHILQHIYRMNHGKNTIFKDFHTKFLQI